MPQPGSKMGNMPARRLGLVMLLLSASVLAGCTAKDQPPIFSIDQVRYWFEGDLLVINATLTNISDFTPGHPNTPSPDLIFDLDEYATVSDWEKEKPAKQTTLVAFDSDRVFIATHIEEPWRKRYYTSSAFDANPEGEVNPGIIGPVWIHPGDSISVEFVFRPDNEYWGTSGLYTIEVEMFIPNLEGESANTNFYSGCFNHDTAEFYAKHPTGPDCYVYDSTGRDVLSGLSIFGQENAGTPLMVHDPPANVPGAH
jgi:hypothetical protein